MSDETIFKEFNKNRYAKPDQLFADSICFWEESPVKWDRAAAFHAGMRGERERCQKIVYDTLNEILHGDHGTIDIIDTHVLIKERIEAE